MSVIAQRIKNYSPGQSLDFSNIRMQPETQAISDSFALMVSNIKEYTVLLEQYKLSVDESSIVSKMNLSGKIIYVNDEFCRVCGYTNEELIDQQCAVVTHPEMEQSIYDEIWTTLKDIRIY